MNKEEIEYLFDKKCFNCQGGKKIVVENPNGFDSHEYLCKKCFYEKYPDQLYKSRIKSTNL